MFFFFIVLVCFVLFSFVSQYHPKCFSHLREKLLQVRNGTSDSFKLTPLKEISKSPRSVLVFLFMDPGAVFDACYVKDAVRCVCVWLRGPEQAEEVSV